MKTLNQKSRLTGKLVISTIFMSSALSPAVLAQDCAPGDKLNSNGVCQTLSLKKGKQIQDGNLKEGAKLKMHDPEVSGFISPDSTGPYYPKGVAQEGDFVVPDDIEELVAHKTGSSFIFVKLKSCNTYYTLELEEIDDSDDCLIIRANPDGSFNVKISNVQLGEASKNIKTLRSVKE